MTVCSFPSWLRNNRLRSEVEAVISFCLYFLRMLNAKVRIVKIIIVNAISISNETTVYHMARYEDHMAPSPFCLIRKEKKKFRLLSYVWKGASRHRLVFPLGYIAISIAILPYFDERVKHF